ncbi:MAG: hypothetical protein ACPGVU_13385 [Limisphaerales bacterium]
MTKGKTINFAALLLSVLIPSVSYGAQPSTQLIQEISTLSSSQFYTNFALLRTMLEGEWNQKVCDQFSYYDGVNLQLVKRYREKLKDDRIWGPFFRKKYSVHVETYESLKPLIAKRRGGMALTDADRTLLKKLDQRIYEELIK